MIAVIDYGMGNLRSVQKALDVVGAKAKITSSTEDIESCEKLVFPGVGAFGEAMQELKRRKLVRPIKNAISGGKPFLGLCLGLQLLFEKSEESPGVKGLSILKGESKRFRFIRKSLECSYSSRSRDKFAIANLKVPHMGWNNIERNTKYEIRNTKILNNVPNSSYMYFVHSYYVKPKDPRIAITTTDYGIKFVSSIRKDNVYAFQFHPEKSQEMGLRILRNFVKL